MDILELFYTPDEIVVILYFVLFLLLSLLVWVLAEFKYLAMPYEHSEEEDDGWDEMEEHRADHELNIRDILKNSTFRGFKAV